MTEKIDYIVQGCASRRVWLLCLARAFAVLFPVLDVIETYAQDLQLDLPEESGPVRVQPAKPVAAPSSQQPEKQPAVQAQPDAPVETPQAESKGRPLQDALRTMSTRLLNVVTADNGQNGAAIVGRAQLSGEYRDRRDGSVQFENVARVDVPLGERFLVRADLPFLWLDPQTSGSTSVTGFGDLSVRLGGQVWRTPGFTVLAGGDIIFPTAGSSELGRGKYQVGPGIAASIPVPELNSVVFPSFQHITSVGGDPSRNDVNYTRLRTSLDTPWFNNQWWTSFEPNLFIDWTQKSKTAMNLEFEVGKRLGEHVRAWVRPAVGLWGTGVPGAYDWYTQVGIRYIF
jgi:Putative MetA-pathway of phenol degradation